MESVVESHLVDHCLKNRLITNAQHGFLQNRSTGTNLLSCLNDWYCAIDERCAIDVFYLDIAKAFDTVCHSKLLYKFRKYGVCGRFIDWIAAFLTNRRQKVKVDRVFSHFENVTSGVPQGSVLGRTSPFFTLYE